MKYFRNHIQTLSKPISSVHTSCNLLVFSPPAPPNGPSSRPQPSRAYTTDTRAFYCANFEKKWKKSTFEAAMLHS